MFSLPTPVVLNRSVDDTVEPALAYSALQWDRSAVVERLWELPEGLSMISMPPVRFGLKVERVGGDMYRVHLLWDRSRLSWPALSRVQLLTTSLSPLLRAIGQDLGSLLDQPAQGKAARLRLVA
jgi:hypothetical protein